MRPVIFGEVGPGLLPKCGHPVGIAAAPREVGARPCDRRGQDGHYALGAADRGSVRLIAIGRERRLGVGEQPLGLAHTASHERPYRLREAQPGPGADKLCGQRREPPVDRCLLGPPEQGVKMLLDQPRSPHGVVGSQGVPDRIVGQSVTFAPGCRRLVQPGYLAGTLLHEAGVQQVGEQLVVAPPAALFIQRDQEQVGLLYLLQQLLGAGLAGDLVTQGPRQPLQHRGLQQELPQRLGLPVQHLLGQVVQHVAVAARERRHKAARVGMIPQRQGSQLQPGRPSLGAALQRRHRRVRHLGPGGFPQKRGRLLRGETQVAFA